MISEVSYPENVYYKRVLAFFLLPIYVCGGESLPQVVAEAYVKSSHTAAGDKFGVSVAISGDTMVVGAYEEQTSNTGINSTPVRGPNATGAAFVYFRQGQNWVQQAYLKPSQSLAVDSFGISVAIDGDTIAVGASAADGARGEVYLFQRSNGAWQQKAKLRPNVANFGGRFGSSVSLKNTTLAVGAPYQDSSGAVYVFEKIGEDWLQRATLKSSSPSSGDAFGISVGAASDSIVVGAPWEDSSTDGTGDGLQDSGAAFVFTRTLTGWSQTAVLKAANADAGDRLGISVAISGQTIAAGAQFEASSSTGINSTPNNNGTWVGAAYVFTKAGNAWSQQAYIKPDSVRAQMLFSQGIALDGDTLAVGAPFSGTGTAYTFLRQGTTWSQTSALLPANASVGDHFGESVAVSGQYVAVGAFLEDSSSRGINSAADELATNAGAAYVYRSLSSGPPGPEIAVIYPSVGTHVEHGGTIDIGTVVVGTAHDVTLQIRNFGTEPLSLNGVGGTVSITGSGTFQIVQAPAAQIAPGNSSSLILRCVPVNPGTLTSTVSIATNDPDENPLVFTVTADAKSGPQIVSNGGGTEVMIDKKEGTRTVTSVQATFGGVPDTRLRYSLAGADRNRFTIGSTTGTLDFVLSPDFELPADFDRNNVYEISVSATLQTSPTLVATQRILVRVTDVPGTVTIMSTSAPKLNLDTALLEIVAIVANESREPLAGFAVEVTSMPARARLINASHPTLPIVEVFERLERQSSTHVTLRFLYRGSDFRNFSPQLEVKALGELNLSPESAEVSAEGRSYPLSLTTSGAWHLAEKVSWITTDVVKGSGDSVVSVAIEPNPSANDRIGILSINGKNHRITQRSITAAPLITPFPGNASAMVGSPFSLQLQVQNLPATVKLEGLPPGLRVSGTSITGTPILPGVFSVSAIAKNVRGTSVPLRFTITVSPFPLGMIGTYLASVQHASGSHSGGLLDYGGQLWLTVSSTGASTGKLITGSSSVSLKGMAVLGTAGIATLQLPIPSGDMVLDLRLTSDDPLVAVTGQVRATTPENALQQEIRIQGYKMIWSADQPPPIDQGERRYYLRPDAGDGPRGFSFGTLRVSAAGGVILAGQMADGTAITCSSLLSPELYQTRIYRSLYRGYGVIDGLWDASRWLPDDIGGIYFVWRKDTPSEIPEGVESAGWSPLFISGEATLAEPISRELPLLGATPVADGQSNASFFATWNHDTFDHPLRLLPGSMVRPLLPNDRQLSVIVQSSGYVSGAFMAQDETRRFKSPFKGLLVRREGQPVVLGYYLHPGPGLTGFSSGSVQIAPEEPQ